MKGIIKLSSPIMIDGQQIKEVQYDTDEISCELFAEADSKKMQACGSKQGNLSGAAELDYGLHLYLGFAAIIAVNQAWTFEDVARIKGQDIMNVMKIGRNFTLSSGESQDDDSDEQSEITQDASTPQSQTWNEND